MPDETPRRSQPAAGPAAGFSALSDSVDRAAAIPAGHTTGTIDEVEHIVVLMQENRSFDHYFGSLNGVRGFGDPRPATLPSGAPVWHQSDGTRDVLPFRPDAEDLGLRFIKELDHEWDTGHQAWNNGAFDAWVPAKSEGTMAYLTRQDIPFHYALADAFTVCDAFHCSFMGPTDPNRYYLWSGHVGNDGKGGGPVLENRAAGYDWTTYPERLEQAGVSWKIYQDIGEGLDASGNWGWIHNAYRGNYGDNSLLHFNTYRDARPGDPLYEKARTGTDAKNGDGLFDGLRADVAAGRLPQVSWIIAPEAFSEHPNWPANYGAWYISQVLDALTSNPDVWSRTALFVTYDENDGFFDHVMPPHPPASAARGGSTVDATLDHFPGDQEFPAGPYGLGPRVPMLVVSPWSTGGFVCSEVFDHTSIIRFMERRFGVIEPNISPWRRAVCGDLTSAFDFTSGHAEPVALPDTRRYEPRDSERHPVHPATSPAAVTLPRQEPGRRPTRPLRYAPLVDATVTPSTGGIELAFSAGESAGGCFVVTSPGRSDAPWTYTAEAGKKISGTWNPPGTPGVSPTGYDLTVHGPNGFLRAFRGAGTTACPEVTGREEAGSGGITLTLTNPHGVECRVTISNTYGGKTETVTLAAGGSVLHQVELNQSAQWYDLSVVCDLDESFLRRFAGHVETGEPGLSDPAIITG